MNQSVLHSSHSPVFGSSTSHHFTSTSDPNAPAATDSDRAITTRTTDVPPRQRTTGEATTTTVTRTTLVTAAASVSAAATLKTTNLIGQHPFQNDNYQWLPPEGDRTSAGEDQGEAENEMGLLWLPYVVFTIVLLGLIAMSFVRFHCQRGDQYRRRRSELEDKVPPPPGSDRSVPAAPAAPASASASHQPNGGSSLVPGRPVRCGDVPEHMVLFLQFTETGTPSGNGSASQDDQWTGTKRIGSTRRVFGFKAQSKVPSVDTTLGGGSDPGCVSDGGVAGGGGGIGKQHQLQRVTCHRRPLTFTFNINGSMVDIRCSDEERTKTFHLSTTRGLDAEDAGGVRTGNGATSAPEMADSSGDGFCLSAAAAEVGDADGRRCSANYRETPRAPTATTTTTTLSSSSRRSSSNKTGQGNARRGGGSGGAMGCVTGGGGVGISPQQKVLMYSMTTATAAGTCELRQKSGSADDEALFLLHPSSRS